MKLHLVLLSIKAPLSRDQHEAFTMGRLVVKSQKFVGHHTFHGGAAITHLATKLKFELRIVNCILAQVPDQPCCYFCPQGHRRTSNNQFSAFDITKSIWCYECRSSHSATSWKCSCNSVWHTGPIHFSSCMVAQSANTNAGNTNRGNRRPIALSSSESARKLARLEPSMASKLCLPPSLAAKFPHLVNRELGTHGRGLPQGPSDDMAQSPSSSNSLPMHPQFFVICSLYGAVVP